MEYGIKVKELDDATDYPLDVLAGMTGLGMDTIRRLEREGRFPVRTDPQGKQTVNGKLFLQWANSVGNRIEVESGPSSANRSNR